MADDTPPAAPSPLPSLGTLSRQIQGLAVQLHGARNDIDTLEERTKLIQQDVADLRRRVAPESPPPLVGVSLSPGATPSMAAKAARGGVGVGKWLAVAAGVLTLAGQVAALFKPGLVGPIQYALQLLATFGGGSP